MCNLLKLIRIHALVTLSILSATLLGGNGTKLTETQQNIYTEQDIGELNIKLQKNNIKLAETTGNWMEFKEMARN